jgi:plasmid stabilization system protein ParE
MSFSVIVLPEAAREIDEAREWWTAHGRERVFVDEVARALRLLERCPRMGHAAPDADDGELRVLLRRVSSHLYYQLDDGAELILVTSLWHTSRRPRH